MGTIVNPCKEYLHMLEVRTLLQPEITKHYQPYPSEVYNPLFILSRLNNKLFCKIIYNAICAAVLEGNEKNITPKYLIADIPLIDALCKHLTGDCPGFETPLYLYRVNILGTELEIIQSSYIPNKGRYDFLIL